MAMTRPRLPSEHVPRSTPLGVAATLAVCIATVLALNAGARHLPDRAGNNLGYRLVDQKWRLVAREVPSPERVVLVVGDSSGNQGVDPVVLAAALRPADAPEGDGPSVLNLCVVADALAVHDAWILGEWIGRHGPPAAVVVVHTFDIWYREADTPQGAALLARVPVPLWRWGLLRPSVSFSRENLSTFLLARWAPLYAEDSTLRAMLADPKTTRARYTSREGIAWQWVDERGFLSVRAVRPQAVARDTRGHQNFLARARFRMSDDNRAGLEALARLGAEGGFPVYIAAAPMHDALWEHASMQRYHAALRDWFDAFEREHPGVRIVLREPVTFPAQQMQNSDHVAAPAAASYSRTLGEAIRAVGGP